MKEQASLQTMGIVFILTFVLISSLFTREEKSDSKGTTVAVTMRPLTEAVNYSPN